MRKRTLSVSLLLGAIMALSAPWARSEQEQLPAYNARPPLKGAKLPPILAVDQLWDENAQYPYQTHAYELAAKIPNVLHQQPCYCYCDRLGHKSLRTCFETTHGAQCSICLKELYYAYLMHKEGKTAAQIRKGVIQGDWKQVSLASATSIN